MHPRCILKISVDKYIGMGQICCIPMYRHFGSGHIYIGIQFSRSLPMYLTATYIGVTHIRRIPMYPTMICADKDYDGDSLGRGLLLMINFPRGSNFPTENTSAQLIPTTKQYLCSRAMSGISGTSVSSPQQITP